jgi:hypothetical protein
LLHGKVFIDIRIEGKMLETKADPNQNNGLNDESSATLISVLNRREIDE